MRKSGNRKKDPAPLEPDREYVSNMEGLLAGLGIRREDRTPVEVWTRVMGYHRPVSAFNPGKAQEHADRRLFVESKGVCDG